MCLHHFIYRHLLQARAPALTACVPAPYYYRHVLQARVPAHKQRVPAAYYLPMGIAGKRACSQSACACTVLCPDIIKVNAAASVRTCACTRTACACSSLFTAGNCKQACLQSKRVMGATVVRISGKSRHLLSQVRGHRDDLSQRSEISEKLLAQTPHEQAACHNACLP